MAKETAVSKRAKISQAEQALILAVLATSILLGAAIVSIKYFQQMIAFNSEVVTEEDASVKKYSDVIKGIGVCEKPKGDIYTDEELANCNPDSIDVSKIPDTLRSNILINMAKNEALNSVPKEANSACVNPATNKNYTYKEMNDLYDNASTSEQRSIASALIQACSALRIVPDALPAFKNEEALLSSLNKIFIISDWEPESLSPGGDSGSIVTSFGTRLNTIGVQLAIEADVVTAIKVLGNIERSIREFNISSAQIEWDDGDKLNIRAQANAYYADKSSISESTQTITAGGTK